MAVCRWFMLQVVNEQCSLAGRGYDGCDIKVNVHTSLYFYSCVSRGNILPVVNCLYVNDMPRPYHHIQLTHNFDTKQTHPSRRHADWFRARSRGQGARYSTDTCFCKHIIPSSKSSSWYCRYLVDVSDVYHPLLKPRCHAQSVPLKGTGTKMTWQIPPQVSR